MAAAWHACCRQGAWNRAVALLGCVSVVLPMYNLGAIASKTISMVSRVLEEAGLPAYEIIAVDDGSNDNKHTFRAALKADIGPHGKLVVLRYTRNRGKGFAVATGLVHASCPYLAFIDGDIDPRQLLCTIAPLHLYDAVVTSKWHPESRTRHASTASGRKQQYSRRASTQPGRPPAGQSTR